MRSGIGNADISARITNHLNCFQNQKVILCRADLMQFFHIDDEAALIILIEHAVFAVQINGGYNHPGGMDGLRNLRAEQTIEIIEQIGIFAPCRRLIRCVFLLDLIDLFQRPRIIFSLIGVFVIPDRSERAADIIDYAEFCNGSERCDAGGVR